MAVPFSHLAHNTIKGTHLFTFSNLIYIYCTGPVDVTNSIPYY